MTVAGTPRILLKIPQASVAVTEGTIVRWLVADGDRVDEGQPLYLLETDKVEMEVEAPAAGTFHPLGEAGQTYPVGADVGYIDAPPAGPSPAGPAGG